jgi:glycosyltransferase involved in cell wall biosynthesis
MNPFNEIRPDNTTFVLVSFEGPDRYSLAGGLGVRVSELSEALAQAGFETHLFFVGSPDGPDHERSEDGRHLWRCCKEIAERYPTGVYEGEEEKLAEFERRVPTMILNEIARPAFEQGKLLVIMGEDWHTAATMCAISDLLYWQGLRSYAILLWNANSLFGFDNIDWTRLQLATRVTAVSRYMKQLMWKRGANALVLPNGIPERHLETVPVQAVQSLRAALPNRLLLTKFARFDPDKNWLPAIQAVGRLVALDQRPLFFMRGGVESYGLQVLAMIDSLGLRRYDLSLDQPTADSFVEAVQEVQGETDIIVLRFFVPEEIQRLLYRASHAVLANSGHEPFGLVGLEVMAAKGVAFVGSTGEGYAQHLLNAISLDTDDPNEIVGNLLYLQHHDHVGTDLRRVGHLTASFYVWPRVIEKLLSKLQYLLMGGGTTWPARGMKDEG